MMEMNQIRFDISKEIVMGDINDLREFLNNFYLRAERRVLSGEDVSKYFEYEKPYTYFRFIGTLSSLRILLDKNIIKNFDILCHHSGGKLSDLREVCNCFLHPKSSEIEFINLACTIDINVIITTDKGKKINIDLGNILCEIEDNIR